MRIATFFKKSGIRYALLPFVLAVLPFFLFAKEESSYKVDDFTGWAYKKDS